MISSASVYEHSRSQLSGGRQPTPSAKATRGGQSAAILRGWRRPSPCSLEESEPKTLSLRGCVLVIPDHVLLCIELRSQPDRLLKWASYNSIFCFQ